VVRPDVQWSPLSRRPTFEALLTYLGLREGTKDCGLANLPFDSFVRNEAWVATSLIAGALLAWSQTNDRG
jgi:hypothetical protein